MKTILYPLTFWLSDYELYDEECQKASDEDSTLTYPRLLKRFLSAIPDSDAAHYRCVRLYYAMSFFHENIDAIELARGAVLGENVIMIKPEIIITLHKFFASIPDDSLNVPISISEFISEVKKAAEKKEN